jgi:hypothetical protein
VIELVYYDNLRWDGARLQRVSRPDDAPDFVDYRAYDGHLQDILIGLARNAGTPMRRQPFELLATVSSGYDSPAAAALGRRAGCRQAICIDKGQHGVDDSGRAVARRLGLEPIEVSREAWRHFDRVEVRTLAGGYLGSVILAGAEEVLRHRVLLTGFHGDKIWAHEGSDSSPAIVRGDCSGADDRVRAHALQRLGSAAVLSYTRNETPPDEARDRPRHARGPIPLVGRGLRLWRVLRAPLPRLVLLAQPLTPE